MNRIYLIIALSVLLVASIGAAGLLAKKLWTQGAVHAAEIDRLRAAVEAAQGARSRAERALVAAGRKNVTTAREQALAGVSLAQAAASAPAWASQPVPEEVQRALSR